MKLNDLFEMSDNDLDRAEQAIDSMFRELGLDIIFTKHFRERTIGDGARDADVTAKEVFSAFNKLKVRYGRELYAAKDNPEQFVGLLKDISTSINMPFSIDYDRVSKGLHNLRVVTVMRKKNFVPNSDGGKVLTVK